MTYRIKALYLTCLMATIALGLAPAPAGAGELHAATAGANAAFLGKQTTEHVFSTDLLDTIRCKEVTSTATAPRTAQELTVSVGYSQCLHFFGLPTIRMNGCKYTVTGAGQSAMTAVVDITGCTVGRQIEIILSGGVPCWLTIPEQSTGGHITLQNAGAAPPDVLASITITGITYEGHGQNCPGLKIGALTHNGQYTGQVTLQSYEDAGSQQGFDGSHQYQRPLAGTAVSLLAT